MTATDDHFVHLARLALSGQRADVVMLVRRVAWRCRETDPDLSAALSELVKDEPTQGPLRNAGESAA